MTCLVVRQICYVQSWVSGSFGVLCHCPSGPVGQILQHGMAAQPAMISGKKIKSFVRSLHGGSRPCSVSIEASIEMLSATMIAGLL